MDIRNKKISILGAVRSGIGAAKLAKKMGAVPFVSDIADQSKLAGSAKTLLNEKIEFEMGIHSDRVFDCDLLIVSPGIPSDSPVLKKAVEKKISVISELEFASWFCKGKCISITGTNGKTTTTSLMGHLLKIAGFNSFVAGNIGLAFSEIVSDVGTDGFVVLETSSFQLDHITYFKPEFSVILNITPDHLDRYDNSVQKYIESKLRIISNQNTGDIFIYNSDDTHLPKTYSQKNVEVCSFSIKERVENGAYFEEGGLFYVEDSASEIVCEKNDLGIKGMHNVANALAVMIVAKKLDISNAKIKEAFKTFAGVEHRLEFVKKINGITFVNDSKATNVDSVWYALQSFDKPIYLILGGKDKGNDYSRILELVIERVKKIYAIGSSALKVYNFFSEHVSVEVMDSLESAVSVAREEASTDSIVLLSPACASFDMFDNYEHRGKTFKSIVEKL